VQRLRPINALDGDNCSGITVSDPAADLNAVKADAGLTAPLCIASMANMLTMPHNASQ